MLWMFVMTATVGLVASVPIMAQHLDGVSSSGVESPVGGETPAPEPTGSTASLPAFLGFALFAGGICGLVALAFDPPAGIAAVAALCLGIAVGAIHPEVLAWLRRRGEANALAA